MSDAPQKTEAELAAEKAAADKAASKETKKAGKYDVVCTLENASTEISGVTFEEAEGGMVASGLTADEASIFRGIPGYEIRDGK